jgi:hypothetical protein
MRGHSPRGQRRAARWVDAAARLGHVATGSVYIIVGADRVGPGITGAANRVAWIVTGVTHFGLALAAFKIALGIRQSTAETGVKRWTELIMSIPFGPWLVAAVGLVVISVGLVMFYRAWTGDIDRWLNLTELPPTIRAIVMGLGRFGLVARGVVLGLAGLFLVLAAIELRPEDARGLGGTRRDSSPTASWSSFGPGIGRSESPEALGLSFGHAEPPWEPKNAAGAETTARLETSNGS